MKESKLPRGVTIRTHESGSTSIQVAFAFKGHQCRESLAGRSATRKEDLRYAADLVSTIRHEIAKDRFDYLKHFPGSPRARKVLGVSGSMKVAQLLDDYLAGTRSSYQPSTIAAWESMIETRLKPALGDILVRDLTTDQITAWMLSNEMKAVSLKYIRNLLTPLRRALYHAIFLKIRTDNPASSSVCNPSSIVAGRSRDKAGRLMPFSRDEVETLIAASDEGPVRNFVEFAFETGLRTGELIGLRWQDVDFSAPLVRVRKSVVGSFEKKPKTAAGIREVELSNAAVEALRSQQEITGNKMRVFSHPKTGVPLQNCHDVYDLWKEVISRAQIPHRPPKMTRHTYASLLISERGVNLFWLAGQMGHTGIDMINRHYGSYIGKNPTYADGRVGTTTGHGTPRRDSQRAPWRRD